MRRYFILLGGALALLVALVLIRTVRHGSAAQPAQPAAQVSILPGAADRLAGSLRFRTISGEHADFDPAQFSALHEYLQAQFPAAHARLLREVVGTHSLLYTWPGSDRALKPILLVAHLDVVPVEAGTERAWDQEPFGGHIVDGFIWGRGAIDNKSAVVGTLEAVEMLLQEGYAPARTIMLAFGHDEEVGGTRGARQIAALLKQRGAELELVLDEGGVIGDGVLPGIAAPAALVGIAEKGFLTLELSTRAPGGHSSLPPRQSAVGILSAAIARLEEHPMPARIESPTQQLFERVAPQFPFAQRVVFANLWLTRPLVLRKLAGSPNTNAMVRTTTAATIFQAGTKDNVLPATARAVVNFRILPGDAAADVIAHVRDVIADPRVEIRRAGSFSAEPSAVSSTASEGFRVLERTIRAVAGDVVVAPYLVVVVTDARYYAELSNNVFRFLPLRMTPADLQRMHGTNERVAVPGYEQAIRFYRQLILNATAG